MKKTIFLILVFALSNSAWASDRSVTIYPKSYSGLNYNPTTTTDRKIQIEPALGFWSIEQMQLKPSAGVLNYKNSSMPYFQGSVSVELRSSWSGLFTLGALKREASGSLSYAGITQSTTETAWIFPALLGARREFSESKFFTLTPVASLEAGPAFLVLPQSVLQSGDGSTGAVGKLSVGLHRSIAHWLIQTQLFATAGKVSDASLTGIGGTIGAGIQL